jgi:hypothetical protein
MFVYSKLLYNICMVTRKIIKTEAPLDEVKETKANTLQEAQKKPLNIPEEQLSLEQSASFESFLAIKKDLKDTIRLADQKRASYDKVVTKELRALDPRNYEWLGNDPSRDSTAALHGKLGEFFKGTRSLSGEYISESTPRLSKYTQPDSETDAFLTQLDRSVRTFLKTRFDSAQNALDLGNTLGQAVRGFLESRANNVVENATEKRKYVRGHAQSITELADINKREWYGKFEQMGRSNDYRSCAALGFYERCRRFEDDVINADRHTKDEDQKLAEELYAWTNRLMENVVAHHIGIHVMYERQNAEPEQTAQPKEKAPQRKTKKSGK